MNPTDFAKELQNAQMTIGVINVVDTGADGTAATTTYSVWVNVPGGGVLKLDGIKPSNSRYPDDLTIIPPEPGTPFIAVFFAKKWHCFIEEKPAYGPCQQ